MNNLKIYSFYKFTKILNKEKFKYEIEIFISNIKLRGTILIADEGINGSISGDEKDLMKIIKFIRKKLNIDTLEIKINDVAFLPFNRIKIRLKKEIVSLGKSFTNLNNISENFINPEEWDNFINQKNINLIDLRNTYEISIGKFKNSLNPDTNSFREFPKKIKTLNLDKDKKIAMYCTGGIRCEKASKYLNKLGYDKIYQLKGGIISYLEYLKKNKIKKSKWSGECFVFDNRVTINDNLERGSYLQCHGCRRPISISDTKSNLYVKGVSCPYCFKKRTDKQKKSSKTRQKQIDMAEIKNISHPFMKITKL